MEVLSSYTRWEYDLADDFEAKASINVSHEDDHKSEEIGAQKESSSLVDEELDEELFEISEHPDEEEEEDDEDDDSDFSFACENPESPIFAEDIFQDGQIRPVNPLNEENGESPLRAPLKKLFVEERDEKAEAKESSEPQGPCCAWSGKAVEASPESFRKSSSTGTSRRWRLRDLVPRSHSDGKDAFVFLHPSSSAKKEKQEKKEKKEKKRSERKEKAAKATTTPSAPEKLYVANRARKEEEKRRSYLPYKQVGFFANVNELSRNIHPF